MSKVKVPKKVTDQQEELKEEEETVRNEEETAILLNDGHMTTKEAE